MTAQPHTQAGESESKTPRCDAAAQWPLEEMPTPSEKAARYRTLAFQLLETELVAAKADLTAAHARIKELEGAIIEVVDHLRSTPAPATTEERK